MIDTKALRSRILDLAIQGKLTEQLESDGTAEELYQQIKKEHNKALSSIKSEDIPFLIPNNWKWVRLGEIASILGGKRIPAGRNLTSENTGHKYIRVSDMKNMSVETSNLLFVPEDIYPSISRYIINKEDVYITVAGTIGKVGTIPDEIDGANLTENADRLVFKFLDKKWLVFSLLSNTVQKQISFLTTQVAQPKLAIKKIQEFILPLPPLAEQKRIVACVEEIFRLLDTIDAAQEQYSADAESLKAKLITAGIQGKLTEQLESDGTAEELYQQIQAEKQRLIKEGKIKKEKTLPEITPDEIPFDIPENWKWVRLKSLGQFSSGKTPSMSEPAFWNGSIAWVSSKDMKKTIITDSEMHITELAAEDMKIHPAGTLLLVARSGILRHSLPLCVLGVDSTINQDIKAFSLHDLSLSKWVYYALKGLEPLILKEYVKAMTTVESLKFEEFSSMPIPLPPLAEQKRIADKLDEVLGAIG